MNKIWLILQREFITRVKKKSFLIMTILGPVLFGGIMIVPIWLATQGEDVKHVLVLDKTGVWNFQDFRNEKLGIKPDTSNSIVTSILPPNMAIEDAKELLMKDESYYGLLYIPLSGSDSPEWPADSSSVNASGSSNAACTAVCPISSTNTIAVS